MEHELKMLTRECRNSVSFFPHSDRALNHNTTPMFPNIIKLENTTALTVQFLSKSPVFKLKFNFIF